MKSKSEMPGIGDTHGQNSTVIPNRVAPAECNMYTDSQQKLLLQPPLIGTSFPLSLLLWQVKKVPKNYTATLHTHIITIQMPFFLLFWGYRDLCGKIESVWFGINLHSCPLTAAYKCKSHGQDLVVKTDYLCIQLGERRNQNIQLLHLMYPKLLFSSLTHLLNEDHLDLMQSNTSCGHVPYSSLSTFEAGIFFRMHPFAHHQVLYMCYI